MKSTIFRELFKKEPKTILLIMGSVYSGIALSCILVISLRRSVYTSPIDRDVVEFNKTFIILQDIWLTYMPLLIVIGIAMIVFSFSFERMRRYQVGIQTGILIVCIVWAALYSIASIPYVVGFRSTLTHLSIDGAITYIFAAFGFGAVFALMTVPNYLILKKLTAYKHF